MQFTDGAKHVADAGGAYWLLDEIALAQRHVKAVAAEAFQLWRLMVCLDHTGILTCEDGNGIPVYRKALEFTDLPVTGVTLYFTDKHHGASRRRGRVNREACMTNCSS